MKFLNNIDLGKNQIENVVLHSLIKEPDSPEIGQLYFNMNEKRAYIYIGNRWLALDAKDASPTAVSIVNTINEGSALINIGKVEGLESKLAPLETKEGSQNKANTALNQAKEFTRTEIAKVIGGASEQYDTLKEIEDLLKNNSDITEIINILNSKTTKYVEVIGDGIATEFDVRHMLNSQDVIVQLRENISPFETVYTDIEIIDENSVRVKFAKAPNTNEYKVITIG
ncbi:hypothetical protein [Peptostreptococcus faecalis]|uniref:hypothetical protein n=1 Tax=Peptostreptococcus faecalis TaxID=2045015 RepID=UPI000C7E2EB6|nr:hypothetical protein [Peptostreptococcus faecalis]